MIAVGTAIAILVRQHNMTRVKQVSVLAGVLSWFQRELESCSR